MNDPWTGIIAQIVPEYKKLVEMSNTGPYIKPEIQTTSAGYCTMTLQEVWDGARGSDDHSFSSSYLDDTIAWAVSELEKWQCKRTAYDTWQFKKQYDAEKFKTLFLLKWPN
jgi:hypothetical protein